MADMLFIQFKLYYRVKVQIKHRTPHRIHYIHIGIGRA